MTPDAQGPHIAADSRHTVSSLPQAPSLVSCPTRVSARQTQGLRAVRHASSLPENAPHPAASIPDVPSTKYTAVTHPEDPSSVPRSVKAMIDRSSAYVLPVYARPPVIMSHGKGAYIWDTEGRRYLDFSAVPRVTDVVTFVFDSKRAASAGRPAPRTHPQGTTSGAKVFFSNSGTEANEGALKVARKVGKARWAASTGKSWDDPACDKYEIVCFERGFHGRSMGALSVTTNPKYQKPFAPLLPGVKVGRLNVLEDLDRLLSEKTCAVIVEPIQGEGGVHAADVAWLQALRKKCDEVGAVLIYDEIQDRFAMGSFYNADRSTPGRGHDGEAIGKWVPNWRGSHARRCGGDNDRCKADRGGTVRFARDDVRRLAARVCAGLPRPVTHLGALLRV
ncbi:hypothetical protein EVJ58_g10613 [Rhodofomes roseus]|uniref:Aminotransferase class III n=1 Tax=Rhodofomes roseus TaxID=34475 RepID=A0A4Y9XM39_9APHY|nr:hypothetical protein EVJ58_g10613 [Rhodofomes roseus]